jgi:hypothetical protein
MGDGFLCYVAAQVRSSWNTLIPYMEELVELMQNKLDIEAI